MIVFPAFSNTEPVTAPIYTEIQRRMAEFAYELDSEGEQVIAANEVTIGSAVAIIRWLSDGGIEYDYAFGEDGSIIIHSRNDERTEFVDILPDGRIRYSLRTATMTQERVLVPEEAATFVALRDNTATSRLRSFYTGGGVAENATFIASGPTINVTSIFSTWENVATTYLAV